MTLDDFIASLSNREPPPGLSQPLAALWHERKGDWAQAHACAQACEGTPDDLNGAWVHAYLHRVEGDPGNAAYWYRRARKPVAEADLAAEWQAISAALLS